MNADRIAEAARLLTDIERPLVRSQQYGMHFVLDSSDRIVLGDSICRRVIRTRGAEMLDLIVLALNAYGK